MKGRRSFDKLDLLITNKIITIKEPYIAVFIYFFFIYNKIML